MISCWAIFATTNYGKRIYGQGSQVEGKQTKWVEENKFQLEENTRYDEEEDGTNAEVLYCYNRIPKRNSKNKLESFQVPISNQLEVLEESTTVFSYLCLKLNQALWWPLRHLSQWWYSNIESSSSSSSYYHGDARYEKSWSTYKVLSNGGYDDDDDDRRS